MPAKGTVPAKGLEPPTPRFEAWCSGPLSYTGVPKFDLWPSANSL